MYLDNEPAKFDSYFRNILDEERQYFVASNLYKRRGERGFEIYSSTFSKNDWGEKC